MPGATPYSPVATSQGVAPYQGAVPATWAYQTDMTNIIAQIMPLFILMMLFAMLMPMFKGITESVK